MFHGIPGSGKSTAAAEQFGDLVIVNRDAIRTELFGEDYHNGNFPKKAEKQVTRVRDERIIAELLAGRDVVSDDTNLGLPNVTKMVAMAHNHGAEVVHINIDVPVEVAKERNAARDRVVPGFVIDEMAEMAYTHDRSHLRNITSRAGRDKSGNPAVMVWRERDASHPAERELAEFNAALPVHPTPAPRDAIVFDMDGTLADVSVLVEKYLWGRDRNFHQFHTDSEFSPAHQWVVDAARKAAEDGYAVVVLTARQAVYVGPTKRWLIANGVPANALFMRGHDDFRPDYEAKKDIVADIERAGYNIVHAYDDNPQVLRLWAELGVPTTIVENPQWADARAGDISGGGVK